MIKIDETLPINYACCIQEIQLLSEKEFIQASELAKVKTAAYNLIRGKQTSGEQTINLLNGINSLPSRVKVLHPDPVSLESYEEGNTDLQACLCNNANIEQRIQFIDHVVKRVLDKFKDLDANIVIADLGSGHLLQTKWLVQSLLKHGYKNLDLHLIDFNYKVCRGQINQPISEPQIPKEVVKGSPAYNFLLLDCASIKATNAFLRFISSSTSNKKEIHTYASVQDYEAKCQENNNLLADVAVCVDIQGSKERFASEMARFSHQDAIKVMLADNQIIDS